MEPIHAHELIREVVNLLKRTLNPNIQIHQELKAQAQCVLGDSAQLHSVLLNLALNARDAMPKGGILSVSTSIVRLSTEEVKKLPFALAPGKFLKIEVKDTGTGIDPQIIDRIFDPFFTTKEVGKGTGLGLAAVYGTIQSHGGSLAVESVPNRGTAFNIFLPLTDRPTRIPLASAKGSHSGQGHVLLIEDDPLVQEMVCAVLENLGYRVSKASDGLAGVNLFKSNAQLFDLIVLDLIMPKMSGEDALKMIRQENPDIPILITSGYSEPLKSDLTLAHGVFFLKKPYDIATFSLRVKELVEVSQANHSA
ncbi:MAG: response regulator [Acidobacteria bacterium]|nr:response regulator [Acidobacteriota bacterium]